GWPMSVFLTPDMQPFFGGTYWPPTGQMGMPGFDQVIEAVREAWHQRRDEVHEQARQLTAHLTQAAAAAMPAAPTGEPMLLHAATMLERVFDHQHGGFGGAPKFPHPMDLRLLLRVWRRTGRDGLLSMVTTTLAKMAAGGIYDHLGGGFHRYSVDARWRVPHFEKMLYDNALLAGCAVEAYQATGDADFARVARETCDFILREMTDAAGGFYSTQDADSEGHEGKFYVWSLDEVIQVLGPDRGRTFARVYDVSAEGNFEDQNILNLPKTLAQAAAVLGRDIHELAEQLAADRATLLAVRSQRVKPGLDDKVLVSWNGLTIDALALAGAALDEPRYLDAALRAADFIWQKMRRPDGRLLHAWRQGQAKLPAYLDDYACLANSLVTLYEATFEERLIDMAVELADTLLGQFMDREHGGFFYTAADHEPLITRQKDIHDASVPSASGMAATLHLRLGALCGRTDYIDAAGRTLEACAKLLDESPMAAGQLLLALDFKVGRAHELAFVAGESAAPQVLSELRRRFWPNKVAALRPGRGHSPHLDGLFEGKRLDTGQWMLYLCQAFACQQPAIGPEAILAVIEQHAPGP
ncbi:MAG TPA: thioredoxin domain-containing protein, partial [Pirellulales bacterium]